MYNVIIINGYYICRLLFIWWKFVVDGFSDFVFFKFFVD